MRSLSTFVKWSSAGLAPVALIVAPPVSANQNDAEYTTLSVTGVGYEKQETGYLQLGATTSVFALEASQAMQENAAVMQRLRSQLARFGVDDDDFKTGEFQFREATDPKFEGRASNAPHGFIVEHSLAITIRDADDAGLVMDALVGVGATNLLLRNQPRWWGSQGDVAPDVARSARQKAVDDAIAKAEDYAAALGMRVHRVAEIRDNSVSLVNGPIVVSGRRIASGPPTEISTNEQTVQASVAMQIELEPLSP